jgi:hypothetical protein
MINLYALGAATVLTLALAAAAPAMASSTATIVKGQGNSVDVEVSEGGQLGTYVDGNDNDVDSFVSGRKTRVVHGALGSWTHTRATVIGRGNQVGTVAHSRARVDAEVYGDDNGAALRAGSDTKLSARVHGVGNQVRETAN